MTNDDVHQIGVLNMIPKCRTILNHVSEALQVASPAILLSLWAYDSGLLVTHAELVVKFKEILAKETSNPSTVPSCPEAPPAWR